ncbi:MAG: FixH family protein [Rhizobiales bacterium]|nr:FixH family protein [Hyphomicrobiales bacterium]
MTAPHAPAGRRDRWIPAAFVLFFVGLAGIEAWFIVLAESSFSGLVTERPALATDAAPAATGTGLRADVAFEQTDGLAGRLTISIADGHGERIPVEGLRITAERLTRFPQRLPVRVVETAAGLYTAEIRLPLAGPWTIRSAVSIKGETIEQFDSIEVAP